MKVVILAGGYATRLYPKTLNCPKALLKYKYGVILDYILNNLKHPEIHEIILVSNNKFYKQFEKYIIENNLSITLLNDGSTCPDNRLGAVKDLLLGIDNIFDDVLVMASDNILDFDISGFIDYFLLDKVSTIMYYKEYNGDKLSKTGQAIIDNNILINFFEKPLNIKSNNACPPFYIFNKMDLKIIKNITEFPDSIGSLISILKDKINIKCYLMPGKRIDIGS